MRREAVDRLTDAGFPYLVSCVLASRGIESPEDASEFLLCDHRLRHSPLLMAGMEDAVERIGRAIANGEKIAVYGDYDVDGITATVILVDYLKSRGADVLHYIPRRIEDGYGLNTEAIALLRQQGVSLMITVDCGITGAREVDFAASLGMDTVVTDHHECKDDLPRAAAVVNPHRPDCPYPFKHLAGCGVALKLVLALGGPDREEALFSRYCTLAAIGTVADVMLMADENRTIVSRGLATIDHSDFIGLHALLHEAGLDDKPVTSVQIGFVLSPRINAAGRMGAANMAADLLLCDDPDRAAQLARELCELNRERQQVEQLIYSQALEMIDALPEDERSALVLADDTWHQGVVGIVASRLVEAFYKPTVVLTKSNGFVTGSARSVQGFDLYASIESCADLLENFGGHVYAAGLTMKEEHLEEFCRRMDSFVSGNITREELTPVVEIDAKLDFSQITPKFTRLLKQFQPFGPGNNNPVFLTEDVYDAGNGRKVGAGGLHLKLDLMQESQPYRQIAAIGFNMAEYFDHIKAGNPIDICYSIVENFYRGSSTVQLRLKDIRERDELI
jgi:single-stranded-DNA-specific exonuclease